MKVEEVAIDRVIPYARNPRRSGAIAKVAGSLKEFGWKQPIVVDAEMVVIAGHTRLEAARQLGMTKVPVLVARDLDPVRVKAYRIADNRVAQDAEWDAELLRLELTDLQDLAFDLPLLGFEDGELAAYFAGDGSGAREDEDDVPEPPEEPVTQTGDLWVLGNHRLLCGDALKSDDYARATGGVKANLVFTSPPYASQRKYDESSGFKPIAPDEYVDWYAGVASRIRSVLAADGSYFLNIKEHCEGGQRHLYVKDLTIAHVRQWGFRFIDEFCWRDARDGVPGGWNNRFKDAWEPVFHFASHPTIKFHPLANGHASDGVFDYSSDNAKARTGSGLLGEKAKGMKSGTARPSNVIEVASATTGDHSAPFPVALPAWFIRAFSDPGDVVLDPFMGSGSTLIAAEREGRHGVGIEISPIYCDVIIERWMNQTGEHAILDGDGRTISELEIERRMEPAA